MTTCIVCQSTDHNTLDKSCPRRLETPLTNITAFKGKNNVFSNFYLCPLLVYGRSFKSAEHAYQFLKAKCYGKDQLAETISRQINAYFAKRLARNIQPDEGWDHIKIDVMRDILIAKEKCVPEYRQHLLEAMDTLIVEAVPGDTFWSCGLSKDQLKWTTHWPGKNIMGLLHMERAIAMKAHMVDQSNGELSSIKYIDETCPKWV